MALAPTRKIRYEFDKSGQNPDNLVTAESHVLQDRQVRVITPRHAHFYIAGVVITDKATGQVVPRSSYHFDDVSEAIAMRTGLGAASIIVITDRSVSKNITVTYQAVGGEYTSVDVKRLQERLEEVNLDNRPISWNNIFNKPSAFNPTEHFHPIWQTFGYEHLVYVVERLVQATLVGDEQSHTVIWEAINALDTKTSGQVSNISNLFNTFISRKDNPHNVTAEQVNTYTKQVIDAKDKAINDALKAHITARGNVHGLTTRDINAYNIPEVDALINGVETKITNLTNTSYTKQQIDSKINPINTNITNLTNRVQQDETNLRDNYYTKQQTDAKDTVDKDYTESESIRVQKIIGKLLFGKYTNPSAQLTNKSGAKFNQTEVDIQNLINQNIGTGLKLTQGIIPISTAAYNQLRWNGDGLYYGVAPDASTSSLYVDPNTGVDEPVTLNNKRGTKEKPLASIGYALSQGPSGVNRTIYIKENADHEIGRNVISIDNSGIVTHAGAKRNHSSSRSCVFRDGFITIRPYGDKYDSAMFPITSTGRITNSMAHTNFHYVFDEVAKVMPRIIFKGVYNGAKGVNGKQTINRYCLEPGNGIIKFLHCFLVNDTSDNRIINDAIRAGKCEYSSMITFSTKDNFKIEFESCKFNTGDTFINSQGNVAYGTFFCPIAGNQTFDFYYQILTSRTVSGKNQIIHTSRGVNSSLVLPEFSYNFDRTFLGIPARNDATYFSDFVIRGDQFANIKCSYLPTPEEIMNTAAPGAPGGTKQASIEFRNGKLYGVYHNGSAIAREQIWPARWS